MVGLGQRDWLRGSSSSTPLPFCNGKWHQLHKRWRLLAGRCRVTKHKAQRCGPTRSHFSLSWPPPPRSILRVHTYIHTYSTYLDPWPRDLLSYAVGRSGLRLELCPSLPDMPRARNGTDRARFGTDGWPETQREGSNHLPDHELSVSMREAIPPCYWASSSQSAPR